MRGCCFSCGVIVGIILALVITAGAVGYYFFRKEPEKARARVEMAEKQWKKIKDPVDAGFEKAKATLPEPSAPATSPAPADNAEKTQKNSTSPAPGSAPEKKKDL